MLGMLNAVWKFIMEFCNDPPVIKPPLPKVVRLELVRFMCAVPLAQMNLRALIRGDVTASDTSEYGGGFCTSKGLMPGVGFFDGIGALRVSADALELPVGGHVSAEVWCGEPSAGKQFP
jgi:hypothetical protein